MKTSPKTQQEKQQQQQQLIQFKKGQKVLLRTELYFPPNSHVEALILQVTICQTKAFKEVIKFN